MSHLTSAQLSMLSVAVLSACCTPALGDDLANLVSGGKAGLEFRYRFESVDQDGISKEASANTLRTRLNLESGKFYGFTAFLEFDDISALGSEKFNSTRNGNTSYPVVADPDDTEVNQAYVQYAGWMDTTLRYGRQRINLDNERFIGGVGFRQNEQTYDGFTVESHTLADTTIYFGYLDNVNRVFGPEEGAVGAPPGDFESESFILNLKYEGWKPAALSLYHYALDFDNDDNAGAKLAAQRASSQTTGARLDGKYGLGQENALLYTGEYAKQSDYGDNPVGYSADYWLLEVGYKFGDFSVHAGDEVLGGDKNKPFASFQTPLATLHKFQGWADKFLVTPNDGIDDRFLRFKAKLVGLNFLVLYDDYQAEDSSLDYGKEWGFLVGKKFGKNYELKFEYADYSADDFATDTTKYWLTGSMAF